MKAIIRDVGENEKAEKLVLLPAQHTDFMDVFNKHGANILPQHTQHDFVIETEDNKVPSFGSIYDHSRLELKVLRKYIDKMLAKKLIVPFKSPLEAPVLFTKKIDGGLHMCVDFWGLNAIIKKNKHPLLLVCTLLNLFAGAKKYTKVDIIIAYNTIRIRARDE